MIGQLDNGYEPRQLSQTKHFKHSPKVLPSCCRYEYYQIAYLENIVGSLSGNVWMNKFISQALNCEDFESPKLVRIFFGSSAISPLFDTSGPHTEAKISHKKK